ncbi:hypothetical protein FVO59_14235 [Microbacterium esteraromaticum]|uniref:Uncharacterized protein n=1 Tax=Microbacterium esteraromaticum TaxID=57043 RepID=A0A7D7WI64_9MICO|nr:hypothetical protein [Microbacterium esteraromaticum]QMU98214.1 hypothetical protein FVO59_14235 [Microbacterium esteraromaticum]
MTDTTRFAAAVRGYRDEITAAMQISDDSLSATGLGERQRAAVAAARARLLSAVPPLPEGAQRRDDVLAGLGATTADAIARMQHEQGKVRALLDAGRPLGQIIASADDVRALAIADLVETLPQVLDSKSGAEIVAEVRGLVFDRLADLGVEAAAGVRDVEQKNAPAIAWHRAMTETAAGSDATVAAWQDVYRADPEGYEVVREGFDGQVDEWTRRLDLA